MVEDSLQVVDGLCWTFAIDSWILPLSFTELNEKHAWHKLEYASTFDLSMAHIQDTIPRVDARMLSAQEFIDQYEKDYKPVVLTHCQVDWQANEKWTKEVVDSFAL